MSKKISMLLLALFAALLISFTTAYAEEENIHSQPTFTLPLSLQEIEEDAFAGTAAETVILPEGLLQIGDEAFAGMSDLSDVYIPGTTEYIADTAFSITADLTIHGIEDSYAEEWANKHQIPFLADDIWHVAFLNAGSHSKPIKLVVRFLGIIMFIIFIALYRRGRYFERSKRPQDRPELNPIDYCFP